MHPDDIPLNDLIGAIIISGGSGSIMVRLADGRRIKLIALGCAEEVAEIVAIMG